MVYKWEKRKKNKKKKTAELANSDSLMGELSPDSVFSINVFSSSWILKPPASLKLRTHVISRFINQHDNIYK